MTVEEAFAMMEDAEKTKEDNTVFCEIDAETRKITVPETYKILGVESDEDSERVYFRAPRIVGDKIDLATLGLRINYQNANSQKDSYPVDDLTVENEFITFSWLLSRKAVAYKGAVKFIVCAVRIGDNAEISNEWNTTLASAEVLEGLEGDLSGIPDEEGKDLLEALIAQSQVKLMEVGEATEEAKRSAERADTAADSAGDAADAANNAAEEARRAVEELKGGIGIDDNVVSENKTYSSKKIEEMAAVNWIPEFKLKLTQNLRSESKYENGKLTVFNTQPTETNHAYTRITLSVKKNTEYTINWKSERTGKTGGGIWINGTDNSVINKEHTNELNGSFTFNTGEKEEIFILFIASLGTNSGGAVGDSATFRDIMLVEGEHPSGYIENVRDIVKKMAWIDAETLDVASRFDTISSGDVLDIKKSGIYFAGSNLTGKPENTGNGMLIVAYSGESNRVYVYIGTNHSLYVRRFAGGGNTDSGWVNKALTVDDIVNNFTTTIAGKALDARAGKTLDEKITESNGNLVYTQQFIPEIAKNNIITDLLNININGVMNEPYMYPGSVATEDASTLKNSPIKTGAFYTYREVFFIPNQGIVGNTYGKTIIRLTEAYPVSGRIWTNVYNTDLNDWTGWKSITPV